MKPSNILLSLVCVLCVCPVALAKSLPCGHLLTFQTALRAQATAAQILAADEDESTAYGFVGISDKQLLNLLNTGKLSGPLTLRITTDHPALKHLKIAPVDWRTASRRAIRDARVQTAIGMLREVVPQSAIDGKGVAAVLERLEPPAGAHLYSPTLAQIEAAATAARLPDLGRGEGAKLRRLAYMIGLSTTVEPGPALLAALGDLPAGAGARLAVSDRVASRIGFADGTWVVSSIDIRDVLTMGAHSSATNEFLEELAAQAVAAMQPAAEEGT